MIAFPKRLQIKGSYNVSEHEETSTKKRQLSSFQDLERYQEKFILNGRLSCLKMSDFWKRKMRTHFDRMDLNNDGVISRKDFEIIAEKFCATGKLDSVKARELKTAVIKIWLIYMDSTDPDENGLLTEAVLIESLGRQRNDSKVRKNIEDICRSIFDATPRKENDYLKPAEFSKSFEIAGILPATGFAEHTFKAIDTNHAKKLSRDQATDAFVEFLFSEDEGSPYISFFGPLV